MSRKHALAVAGGNVRHELERAARMRIGKWIGQLGAPPA